MRLIEKCATPKPSANTVPPPPLPNLVEVETLLVVAEEVIKVNFAVSIIDLGPCHHRSISGQGQIRPIKHIFANSEQ